MDRFPGMHQVLGAWEGRSALRPWVQHKQDKEMKQKWQRCVRRVKKTQGHEVPEPCCKEKDPQLVTGETA